MLILYNAQTVPAAVVHFVALRLKQRVAYLTKQNDRERQST